MVNDRPDDYHHGYLGIYIDTSLLLPENTVSNKSVLRSINASWAHS